MLNKLVGRVVSYMKNRGAVEFALFLFRSSFQLVRGLSRGYWMVFVGRGVTIRARRKVKIGRFTRIEDYVELDGFGVEGIKIGEFCKIGKYSILRVPPVPYLPGIGISVGDRTTIAEFCFIGGAGRVEIGERNSFGQYVSVHPQNHLPVQDRDERDVSSVGVVIGCDNWLGAKSTLLDNSCIGNRSIVAAGAIVTKQFKSDSLLAGVPAKIKRSLNI
jgi:acetyltransferase-like isoleucine patch superfamily enzyme